MMDEKLLKVTYSFDGKVMPVKELHLEEKKLLAPHVLIQENATRSGVNSSLSQRTISTRNAKTRFDPKKSIVA